MNRISTAQIMGWRPCPNYPEKRVQELVGDGKTALEILALDIPEADRLWVVLRPQVIPEREIRLLAAAFAEDALPIWEKWNPEDNRPRRAIEAARACADGGIGYDSLYDACTAAAAASASVAYADAAAASASASAATASAATASATASAASASAATADVAASAVAAYAAAAYVLASAATASAARLRQVEMTRKTIEKLEAGQ